MKHHLKQFGMGLLLLAVSIPVLFFIVDRLPVGLKSAYKVV